MFSYVSSLGCWPSSSSWANQQWLKRGRHYNFYIIIYLSYTCLGVAGWGKSLRPRHFLDEFRPISGFQKGLLTRKTSHRQSRKFLLYNTERRVAILEEWEKTLFIVQAQFLRFTRHCLSHCQKLKKSCLVNAADRDVGAVFFWRISSCAYSNFLHPGSGLLCPLNSQKHVTFQLHAQSSMLPEAKKTNVRQNRSSQKPSMEKLKNIKTI